MIRFLLLGAMLAACDDAPSTPPHVVIITLDTTRADHLGSYGYSRAKTPNIDALAASATQFDAAWTVSNNTLPAHVSILSGLHPQRAGVPRNGHKLPADLHWGPEVFQAAGYDTAAFVSASALSGKLGLKKGFDTYDDSFDVKELDQRQRRADTTTDAAIRWLSAPHEAPTFTWIHYFDPHYPYTPPEPFSELYGSEYAGPADGSLEYLLSVWGRGGREKVTTSEADRQRMVDLYDGEIAYLDTQLGRLFKQIDSMDGGEDAVVVLTADHGESLTEHGYLFDHGEYLYEPTLHIPLIIRAPERLGFRPSKTDALAQNVDVMPTVLRLAGVASSASLDGLDLSGVMQGKASSLSRSIFAESCRPWQIERGQEGWKNLRKAQAVRAGDLKLIATPYQNQLELYDLRRDPEELKRAEAGREVDARKLMDQLEIWRGAALEISLPDAENMEQIRALGYIE